MEHALVHCRVLRSHSTNKSGRPCLGTNRACAPMRQEGNETHSCSEPSNENMRDNTFCEIYSVPRDQHAQQKTALERSPRSNSITLSSVLEIAPNLRRLACEGKKDCQRRPHDSFSVCEQNNPKDERHARNHTTNGPRALPQRRPLHRESARRGIQEIKLACGAACRRIDKSAYHLNI
eukprot:4278586-Pleurochrysis_carterae.AAC.1